jgi:hypothetical protein
MPDRGRPAERRASASAACWQLYGEVVGHELEHLARLGRLHQLTVDAYGAQHAGGGSSRLGVAFSLIGLHLAFEDGASGSQVRDAHQYLGRRFREWPAFAPPPQPAAITVFDVAAATSPEAHEKIVVAWARAVWEGWRPEHGRIRDLLRERLPPGVVAGWPADA